MTSRLIAIPPIGPIHQVVGLSRFTSFGMPKNITMGMPA